MELKKVVRERESERREGEEEKRGGGLSYCVEELVGWGVLCL